MQSTKAPKNQSTKAPQHHSNEAPKHKRTRAPTYQSNTATKQKRTKAKKHTSIHSQKHLGGSGDEAGDGAYVMRQTAVHAGVFAMKSRRGQAELHLGGSGDEAGDGARRAGVVWDARPHLVARPPGRVRSLRRDSIRVSDSLSNDTEFRFRIK